MDSPVLELYCSSPLVQVKTVKTATVSDRIEELPYWDPFDYPDGPPKPPGLEVKKPRTLTHRNVAVQTERPSNVPVMPNYLPIVPDQCWRCGHSGHSRETCRRPPILFCSRCGKVGIQSRECRCHRSRPTQEASRRRSREPSRKRVRFQDDPEFR